MMKTIDIVKEKLPDPKPNDGVLNIYIDEVGQAIMNYCNRRDIPTELRYVHANMVIDLMNSENRRNESEENNAVSSIKEGDVQVNFGTVQLEYREKATEALLFDYAKQLNRFRRLRW
ncbi:phage head-tail connector protein [Heyndrickxia oleronia]|nr:phage head-tail connector protein [Heyndrickxia oleronia]MEC1373410.1 phage head-tail connector protein [Heyndrickxia oleronia]